MKKAIKITAKIIVILLIIFVALMLVIIICDRVALKIESGKIKPIGTLVEVDGYNMNVYCEGEKNGKPTIVFISGLTATAPVLNFKAVYSQLSSEYQIAVIEKFGYGYADNADLSADVESVVRRDREALEKAGISAPYVLMPHSYGGLESFYWARKYPEEITALVCMDSVITYDYMTDDEYNSGLLAMKNEYILSKFGLARPYFMLTYPTEIEAAGLTDKENKQFRYLLYRYARTEKPMLNNYYTCLENERIVTSLGVPDVPMFYFLSTQSENAEEDRKIAYDYAEKSDMVIYEIDCGHNMFADKPDVIAEQTLKFLAELTR